MGYNNFEQTDYENNIFNYSQEPLIFPKQTIMTGGGLHPTIVHEQLENLKVLKDIEMQLKGYSYDFRTGELVKTNEPLVKNDECLRKILAIARTHLDKNIKISDLTDEEIYKHMFDLAIELDLFLYLQGHFIYNLKEEDLPIIKRIILNPIFSNYKSSRNGRQLDALREIERITQTSNVETLPKKNILNKLGLKF